MQASCSTIGETDDELVEPGAYAGFRHVDLLILRPMTFYRHRTGNVAYLISVASCCLSYLHDFPEEADKGLLCHQSHRGATMLKPQSGP